MALFGRRFILLVREGVELPSNLQGLYEVRYTGDALDGDAIVKLLEAINDIKNNPLPERHRTDALRGTLMSRSVTTLSHDREGCSIAVSSNGAAAR